MSAAARMPDREEARGRARADARGREDLTDDRGESRARRARRARASWVVPVVGGALVGGLAAGRFETATACFAVAVAGGAVLQSGWPRRSFVVTALLGAFLAVLLNLYLNPGTALAWGRIAGRAPTLEGARYGALLALRMWAACAAWWVLARALPGDAAAAALGRLLRPLHAVGVPVQAAGASLGLALRMAPLVGREASRIARVQAMRAGGPPRGLRERTEQARAVMVPLVVCALERAERVALALEARHYRGRGLDAAAFRPAWPALGAGAALAVWGLLWRS